MQVDFTKHFSKQIDNLHDNELRSRLRMIVGMVINAATIDDIPKLKKLKGHATAYRVRLGNYRIGIFIENDMALFAAFEHRKDIYRKFP
jgi:mRNA interferase RelE/StbE